MVDVRVLRTMYASGASIESIFDVIEADQQKHRSADAARQRRKRERKRNCHADAESRGHVSRGRSENTQLSQKVNGFRPESASRGHSETLSFFFLESERKKESQKVTRTDFQEFYGAYPRKVGKIEAEKAYAKARKRATHAEIMAGLKKSLFPSDRDFIPYPATWLNKGRWMDEGRQQSPWKEEGIL